MSNLDRSIDLEGLANARHITDLIVRRQRDSCYSPIDLSTSPTSQEVEYLDLIKYPFEYP